MTKVKVQVDTSLCIAAATCVASAPSLFQLNEDNLAEVRTPNGPAFSAEIEADAQTLEQLREAAAGCPTSAITVFGA